LSPEETATFMATTRERWGKVVKANGIKVE
jgi:hypothetical protein